jgi:hypothetical protein
VRFRFGNADPWEACMGGRYKHHTLLRADDTLKPLESTLPRQHSRYADAVRYSVWTHIPAPRMTPGAPIA